MKKLADILFKLWFVLLIGFLIFAAYHYYSIRQENSIVETMAQKNMADEGITHSDNNLVHPFLLDGYIENDVVSYAASYYYTLPKEIRTDFEDSGWQILLTDKDISKEYYSGDVKGRLAGLTVSENKIIYISNTQNDIRRSIIHEFGHFFDFQTDITSKNFPFTKIYWMEREDLKEKWKMDDHAISNSQEYFAESFAQFILYPDVLKENCPNTFEYIKELYQVYAKNV